MKHFNATDRKHMLIGACVVLATVALGILLNVTAPTTMAPIHASVDDFIAQMRSHTNE
jgi:hypothetical protein